MLGDRHTLHVLHHEVGTTPRSFAGVKHLGHRRMVHHGQCLLFRLEARDDLFAVHPALDDLEGDAAFDRLALLGEPRVPRRK